MRHNRNPHTTPTKKASRVQQPQRSAQAHRALLFFIALLAFFSPPLSSFPVLSALRFWPAAAAVFTETSVDLPCPPDASFATCASAALQSADASLIAYLC